VQDAPPERALSLHQKTLSCGRKHRLETNFYFSKIVFGNGQFVATGFFYGEYNSSSAIVASRTA
jgi:hypothetical protein